MQAIVHHRYGGPDVLELADVDVPEPADDGLLIRVEAASVNALDWHSMRGEPFLVRMSDGLRRPKVPAMGVDVAGRVEAVGRNVTRFRPGDEVFGARSGAFAEYVSGRTFVAKPAGLSFEEAAAIPVAGTTALQGLRDRGRLQVGQRVLINGASGGVGSFAVQIAKALGAHVTAVCSTANVETVRSIGADRVIDYTAEDFTHGTERYDLILDVAGSRSLRACRRVLTPRGSLVVVGGPGGRWLSPADRSAGAFVLSKVVSQRLVPFLATVTIDDLLVLKDMAESGAIRPVIDRTYPLRHVPDAIRYLEVGHARGKVVITV